MIRKLRAVFAGLAVITLASTVVLAEDDRVGIYIIYDSSNSMWGTLPDASRKYEAARSAMRDLAGRDFGDRNIALRMYGHRRKNDCTDSELIVSFSASKDAAARMVEAMQTARPTGRTPIDLSLRQALDDFGNRRGSIILISDGIESCDADPCALIRAWQDKDIAISVHVVGLGLKGKERAAMQCIADAAGTPYRDAFSAGELIESLGAALDAAKADDKPEPGDPKSQSEPAAPDFALVVETLDGVRQRGLGILTGSDSTETAVRSFQRYTPPPGKYTLVAGVQVVGGAAYRPVTQNITVASTGRTTANVLAPLPPAVFAEFAMAGEEIRATVVTVWRDGKKIGSFKGDETVFLAEGAYEFRSKLAGTSKPLVVAETFAEGDAKTIRFDAATEVHLTVIARGSANGVRLKGYPTTELWRDGVLAHKINNSSGGLVTPGAYMLRINDRLNRFETGITVTSEAKQVLEVDVPAGGLTVIYRDEAGRETSPERVFIIPEGGRRQVRQSSTPLLLMPGTYIVRGWPKASGYPDTTVKIEAGIARKIILKATN